MNFEAKEGKAVNWQTQGERVGGGGSG